MTAVDDIDRLLAMLQGSRMAALYEMIIDGNTEKAYRLAGEANGYRRARLLLDAYREEGDMPEFADRDHWLAYEQITAALDAADDAVGQLDDDPMEPGVE